MAMGDKIKAKKDEVLGKAKQKQGEATDDPDRTAEGTSDQRRANLKQAGESAKDAFKKK